MSNTIEYQNKPDGTLAAKIPDSIGAKTGFQLQMKSNILVFYHFYAEGFHRAWIDKPDAIELAKEILRYYGVTENA